jgi:hypothetical protein
MIDGDTIGFIWKGLLLAVAIGAVGVVVWLGFFMKGWVSPK